MTNCRESKVVHYIFLGEKRLCSNYIQMLWRRHLTTHKMGNLQRTSYHFSFIDVMLQVHVSLDVHSTMGNRNVSRSRHCTSHSGRSALIIQCTETFLYIYIYISFSEILGCSFFRRFITRELTFSLAIWNDWKRNLSCQEVMQKSGNWTERYNWSAGLKLEHQLAVHNQPTPDTKKAHVQQVAGVFDVHMHTRDWKETFFIFWGVVWYDHERSSVVLCPQA